MSDIDTNNKYELVCEIPRKTKAFKANLVIMYEEKLQTVLLSNYVQGDISYRRFLKLATKNEKLISKAWKTIKDFSSLEEGVDFKIKRRSDGTFIYRKIK